MAVALLWVMVLIDIALDIASWRRARREHREYMRALHAAWRREMGK